MVLQWAVINFLMRRRQLNFLVLVSVFLFFFQMLRYRMLQSKISLQGKAIMHSEMLWTCRYNERFPEEKWICKHQQLGKGYCKSFQPLLSHWNCFCLLICCWSIIWHNKPHCFRTAKLLFWKYYKPGGWIWTFSIFTFWALLRSRPGCYWTTWLPSVVTFAT